MTTALPNEHRSRKFTVPAPATKVPELVQLPATSIRPDPPSIAPPGLIVTLRTLLSCPELTCSVPETTTSVQARSITPGPMLVSDPLGTTKSAHAGRAAKKATASATNMLARHARTRPRIPAPSNVTLWISLRRPEPQEPFQPPGNESRYARFRSKS